MGLNLTKPLSCLSQILAQVTQKMAIAILGAIINLCLFITQIVYFWKMAIPIFELMVEEEENNLASTEDNGFVKFMLNFVFYMTIVGQGFAACGICCLVCAVAMGGTAAITARLGVVTTKTAWLNIRQYELFLDVRISH